MQFPSDENVLVGLTRADDAGVYKISDDLALIQTVDFFTPVVEDPFLFGQIAAANALSDVYAMGGTPKTAMNLVAFPSKEMDLAVLRQILEGGMDKMAEAGVVLLGGHSIEDPQIKYGLSVTGFIHPVDILLKNALRPGDCLVLTKPLGMGILTTAAKAGLVPDALFREAVEIMAELNASAAAVMAGYDISACTDITGFGLLGHLAEMIEGTSAGIRIDAGTVPVMPQAFDFAAQGFVPAAAYNNMDFRGHLARFSDQVARPLKDVLFDPQTSGGLLMAVRPDQARDLLAHLRQTGIRHAAAIGRVTRSPKHKMVIE